MGAGAYRFRVLVPPLAREARARLERLVEAQKPAPRNDEPAEKTMEKAG